MAMLSRCSEQACLARRFVLRTLSAAGMGVHIDVIMITAGHYGEALSSSIDQEVDDFDMLT